MPVAQWLDGSMTTRWTIASVTSVHRPVCSASATVVNAELKYEWVTQPRSHGPQ